MATAIAARCGPRRTTSRWSARGDLASAGFDGAQGSFDVAVRTYWLPEPVRCRESDPADRGRLGKGVYPLPPEPWWFQIFGDRASQRMLQLGPFLGRPAEVEDAVQDCAPVIRTVPLKPTNMVQKFQLPRDRRLPPRARQTRNPFRGAPWQTDLPPPCARSRSRCRRLPWWLGSRSCSNDSVVQWAQELNWSSRAAPSSTPGMSRPR